ncbi:MAG: endo-1,3-alpha-glucanase family glycosylhydrolase [Kiritimatiellae bacterium]|jgi:hypothetical protein|nr:endo-1,3-alpha-glucanase family glycosylhydrolase [Kiritimatiellia bacterium]
MKFSQIQNSILTTIFIISSALMVNHATADTQTNHTKMCWAHFVGWGFDQVNGYDHAALDSHWMTQKFNDRSLLGRHVQTDQGAGEGTKKQIRTALQYGVDGFCVDLIIRESHDATFYARAMRRFYRAAEGTPFKIALCLDSSAPSPDAMTDALETFLRQWGHHPNSCLVDGKPVIFIYNSHPRTLNEWKGIIATLQERKVEAYWLVQPQREGTLWGNSKVLAENLTVFDGFYDFGINGFTPEQMLLRLTNGQKAIAEHNPGAILSAGITQGYLGNGNSFYRPYLNTGTLRNNWEAAIKSKAPWVCITTWNDYVEHTHFEPSVVNRDALLRINRDYLALWRGTPVPPRPPQIFISYHEECNLGDDWTLEILSLPYTTAPATIEVRLLNMEGDPVFEPAPTELPTEIIHAETLRLPQPGIDGPRTFRVQARIISESADSDEWRELYPIIVRAGHMESLRTIRIPLDELAATPTLKIVKNKGQREARIRFNRWSLAGKVELLRNGWPVAETNIAHKKAPSVTINLPLPETDATPSDMFIARYSNLSGDVSWSTPCFTQTENFECTTNSHPVIVTGSDFDEGWGHDGCSRFDKPLIVTQKFTQAETFALTYRMNEGKGDELVSISEWKIPAILGGQHKWMHRNPEWVPRWVTPKKGHSSLCFDGTNDCVILPSRMMPYGPFTLEMNIKPEKCRGAMTLFSDFCGISLQLTPNGHIQCKRSKNSIISQQALIFGEWTHLGAVYNGNTLKIYINAILDSEAPAEIKLLRINSLPVIGNNNTFNRGFFGNMGGFHLQTGVLEPESFVLIQR